jgi:hypothetical protein
MSVEDHDILFIFPSLALHTWLDFRTQRLCLRLIAGVSYSRLRFCTFHGLLDRLLSASNPNLCIACKSVASARQDRGPTIFQMVVRTRCVDGDQVVNRSDARPGFIRVPKVRDQSRSLLWSVHTWNGNVLGITRKVECQVKGYAVRKGKRNKVQSTRVAIVFYGRCSVDSVVARDARALHDAGFEVDVIGSLEPPLFYEHRDGITTFRLPPGTRRGGLGTKAFAYVVFPAFATVTIALLTMRRRYDFVEIGNLPD